MKMKWFVRTCVVAALSFTATHSDSLYAQGARTQATSDAAVEVADRSVVVVALAPIDKLIPNVQHLARLTGGGQAAGTVASMLRQFTGGIDTSKPVGVFVELDETGTPSPIGCLPIKNLEQFFAQLGFLGEPEDLGDGLYAFHFGNSVYLRKTGNWLVVAQSEDSVMNFDSTVTSNLDGLVSRYDLRVQANPQNLPPELVEFFISQVEQGVEQNLAQEMDEAQAELARKNSDQMVANLKEAIEGTEKFVIGLAVSQADKKTYLDIGSKFVAGSKFAKQLEKYPATQATLAGFADDASMFGMKALQFVLPEEVKQLEDSLQVSLDALFKQIDEENGGSPASEKGKELIERLAKVVVDSAKTGSVESAVNASVAGNLNVSAAITVANGKEIDSVVADFVKALQAENEKNIVVEQGLATHGGANLHRISFPLPPEADDKARKIFGDKVELTLASTPKVVYVGVGKDSVAHVKAGIDRVAAKPTSPAEMFKSKFQLNQLAKFMQSIDPSPVGEAIVETTSNGGDTVTVDSRVNGTDSVIRVAIEDNVLRSIHAATQAAQGSSGF